MLHFLTFFAIIIPTGDFMELSNIKINNFSEIRTKIFTKDEIIDYIRQVVSYLEITDYLSEIIFTNVKYQDLASYNFKSKELKMSLIAIMNEAKMEVNYDNRLNYTLLVNLTIILTLIHEINHTLQNYLIHESDLPLFQIFEEELDLFADESQAMLRYYQTNHSSFIFEREANINSCENILRILNNDCFDQIIFEYFYDLLKKELLSGYAIHKTYVYSPIERIYKDLIKKKHPSIDGVDLYDRIKLGFNVSKEDFDTFSQNIDQLILSKNNLPKV